MKEFHFWFLCFTVCTFWFGLECGLGFSYVAWAPLVGMIINGLFVFISKREEQEKIIKEKG